MKKINFSPKTNIFIGLFVVVIIIAIIIFNTLSPQSSNIPSDKNQPISFPSVTTSINTPNEFTWQIDQLILPEEVETVTTKQNTQGETILKNLAKNLGFIGKPEIISNSPIIFFNNPLNSTDIYLNTDENLIKFSLNLLEKPIPITKGQNEITPLLQQSLNLPPSISITKNSTHYQKTNGPRFINTTKDKATLITSTYNYSYKSLPILFPKGSSISITQSLSGKPVDISINLPPSLTENPNTQNRLLPVKTIEQIKNTSSSQFITIALSGNQRFSLSDQEIEITEATIENGFLGYIYSQNTLIPHIFLTGKTKNNEYGTIEILLAIPATE
jgi:hypothetical protein